MTITDQEAVKMTNEEAIKRLRRLAEADIMPCANAWDRMALSRAIAALSDIPAPPAPVVMSEVERLRHENVCLNARVKQLDYPCSPHCDGYLRELRLRDDLNAPVVSEAMVERAAEAEWNSHKVTRFSKPWSQFAEAFPDQAERYRSKVRTGLEAALQVKP